MANNFNWKLSAMSCFLTWLIPFILFSPVIFGFTSFWVFGFDYRIWVCGFKTDNVAFKATQHMSVLEKVQLTILYVTALISGVFLIVSYVYLGLFIKKETNKIASMNSSGETQVNDIKI